MQTEPQTFAGLVRLKTPKDPVTEVPGFPADDTASYSEQERSAFHEAFEGCSNSAAGLVDHPPMEDFEFTADDLIDDYQREQYMSIDELRKMTVATPRLEIIDPMSYQPNVTKCPRTRVVTLLRLLEDDVRAMRDNRMVTWDDLVTPNWVKQYSDLLNALVWKYHRALVTTLKAIKNGSAKDWEQFHIAIENMGYVGGVQTKGPSIRICIRHHSMPIGQIVV